MSDDPKDVKAKKLAAARKKLKEYQKRNMESAAANLSALSTSTTSVASSEKSDINTEIEMNSDTPTISNASSFFDAPTQGTTFDEFVRNQLSVQNEQQLPMDLYFDKKDSKTEFSENPKSGPNPFEINRMDYQQQQQQQQLHNQNQHQHQQLEEQQNQQQTHINAMQLLITEKTQLTAELNKYRNICQEQSSELDEVRSQLAVSTQHHDELNYKCKQLQQSREQLSKQNAELLHKLSQANAQQEDQMAHVIELQQQLKLMQAQADELDEKYKQKCNECELKNLRLQQISNEPNMITDNRVETLTQNQFMYEQQIRDLQAMVQQFTQDKEQSSTQYQNYVQHLNAEIVTLNDRNLELTDECTKLQERERQLVDHVSDLEKELQKHLSQRQAITEVQKTPKENGALNDEKTILHKQIEDLQERINDFEFERHEFQLKIKSQEDRLQELQQCLTEKEEELERVKEHMSEQPDQMKLLATMESDKVAASRALTQNVELKKQLDELELRFVQLTNDKAELTNKLDAEEFANREMRINFASMEERIRSLDERFQFKDAEMIRLSHENMELAQHNSLLQKQLNVLKEQTEESKSTCSHDDAHSHNHDSIECNGDTQDGDTDNHSGEHSKIIENHETKHSESDSCEEARENEFDPKDKSFTPQIPTAEAVEKLQTRFTYLMSQVADLTEEKQRLEHLVLQLQGETETIGEYITLYQTQRRILKQREYEKAAQARLLQDERQLLREKIGQLNQLVSRLGYLEKRSLTDRSKENQNSDDIKSRLNTALAESMSIEAQDPDQDENNVNKTKMTNTYESKNINFENQETEEIFDIPETNEILMKIQNIVTEIKENATKEMPLNVDHCHCCEGQLKVV